jgi:hypothetical protein
MKKRTLKIKTNLLDIGLNEKFSEKIAFTKVNPENIIIK